MTFSLGRSLRTVCPSKVVWNGVASSVPLGKKTPRAASFAFSGLPAASLDPGQEVIPRNYGRGPAFFAVSLRASKTLNFRFGQGTKTASGPSSQGPSTGTGRQPAGTAPAERTYSLSLSLQAWNFLNRANVNLPVGNLSSPFFGQSTAVAGSFGGGDPSRVAA